MSPERIRPLLIFGLRLGVSVLFAWAGLLKLRDADATQMALFQYKLLSWEASGVAGTFLPMVEVFAAIGLWIPRLRLGAATLCLCLTTLFIGALGSAVARNLDISCGCFGTSDLHTTALRRLLEDLVLAALCVPLWREAASRARCENGE